MHILRNNVFEKYFKKGKFQKANEIIIEHLYLFNKNKSVKSMIIII